jgi:2-hydroxy-6-oxonona-2,4-dienedioate hydrolase
MQQHRSIWSDFLGQDIRQRWVTAEGVRTRVLEAGSDQAPVLVMLHGAGGHAEAYTRNIGAHADDFHVFSVDMLGHGFTDKPEQAGYEIADYVEHLRAFLDAIGADRASISGESLGGWVAMAFALKYPDRVHKLVLNTTGGYVADPAVMEKLKTISRAAVRDPKWETVRARLEFLMVDPANVTADLIATRLAIYKQPGFIEAMDRILCLQEIDIRRRNMISAEQLAQIDAPTFVIWTTHDPTAPASVGRELASHIPGAGFVVMEDCGHWPQFEDAATFNRLQLDFLRS